MKDEFQASVVQDMDEELYEDEVGSQAEIP